MQTHPHQPSGSGSRVLRWVQYTLVVAGAAMLAAWAWSAWDARVSQRAARQVLESAAPPVETAHSQEAGAQAGPTADEPVALRGSPIAALSIPRIRLSAVVLQGSDARTLRHGPGHLANTAAPGDSGNVVIAGHRDSFFRPLKDVQIGDDIFLETPTARVQYRVTSLWVVKPTDLGVIEPAGESVLTLITCYPFWMLGNAPDRFVVRAVQVTNATAAPVAELATSSAIAIPDAEAPTPSAPAAVPQLAARPEVNEPVVSTPAPPPDSDTLVRQAIESYRLTYNGRLVSRHEVGEAPLIFHRCIVTMTEDEAEAACEPSARTFLLQRTPAGWAIRSVIVR
jgi:sortase A